MEASSYCIDTRGADMAEIECYSRPFEPDLGDTSVGKWTYCNAVYIFDHSCAEWFLYFSRKTIQQF
jgi:hypothetical protein